MRKGRSGTDRCPTPCGTRGHSLKLGTTPDVSQSPVFRVTRSLDRGRGRGQVTGVETRPSGSTRTSRSGGTGHPSPIPPRPPPWSPSTGTCVPSPPSGPRGGR